MGALDILAAASGSLYLVTMTTLGVRLVFLSRRNRAKPELWLAIAFLAGGSFGASSEVIGSRFLAESHPAAAFWVVGLGKLTSAIGLRSYDYFVWRVFRPGVRRAGALFVVLAAGAGIALVGFVASGTLERGPGHAWFWLELAVRVASPIWLAYESLRFWSQMRRRSAIGLADPLVTERFRLWATGALTGLVMLLCSVPPQILSPDHPLQKVSLLILGLMGLAATASYWFAFFPPEWYRSRVSAGTRA
jgi:energy-converting hydrogenase Eha subunit E